MKVESLEIREIEDFIFDFLKVIVGNVQPFKVLGVPHHHI
jgi:hypothetical protein